MFKKSRSLLRVFVNIAFKHLVSSREFQTCIPFWLIKAIVTYKLGFACNMLKELIGFLSRSSCNLLWVLVNILQLNTL